MVNVLQPMTQIKITQGMSVNNNVCKMRWAILMTKYDKYFILTIGMLMILKYT